MVDREAPVWRERLANLHLKFFGPGVSDPLAPVQLEVIDRATHETLKRLQEAGLVLNATRATRAIYPFGEVQKPAPLTEEEKQKANAHRAQTVRKLKMGRLLAEGELLEESRAALLEGIHSLINAVAVEQRFPAPTTLEPTALMPFAGLLGEHFTALRTYLADAQSPWEPVAKALAALTSQR